MLVLATKLLDDRIAAKTFVESGSSSTARFGVFELDLASGELRKSGVKVRLQEQPFQVLKTLAEKPGEVVSREELQERLWPDETFVDFEDGLSTAIRKVRSALGDSASNPRFIETLPKRGYRFIASVEKPGAAPTAQSAYELETPAPTEVQSPNRRARYLVASIAGAVTLAGTAVWLHSNDDPASQLSQPYVAVPLTSYPGAEQSPSFSPDGSQVAFSWTGEEDDNQDIYLTLLDGGPRSRLTNDYARDFAPAWSPDGSLIAFMRRKNGIDEIRLVSPLGGRERKLIELLAVYPPAPVTLSWSPDGQMLAFTEKPAPDAQLRIGLVSTESGQLSPLTDPQDDPTNPIGGWAPAFSPDGSRIAFVRSSRYRVTDLFVAALDGASPRRVTSVEWDIRSLAWSPSGTELFFTSEGPGPEVWRVNLSGGDPKPVLGLGQDVGQLALSHSGDRLAYTTQRIGDKDIWKVPLDPAAGSQPERFIGSTHDDGQPHISFDGARFAFRSERSGYPEIWIADIDGSNESPLTSQKTNVNAAPRWSPDNRHIVFTSNASGRGQAYKISANGGVPQALTPSDSYAVNPAWSPDGEWIYFESRRDGSVNVWRVRSDGGEPEQITTAGGGNARVSPDGGGLFYFAQARTNSLWRMDLESRSTQHFVDLDGLTGAGCYQPLGDELYFIAEQGNGAKLKHLGYNTRQINEVVDLEGSADRINCFSLAPDRSWLLYTRLDEPEVDMMLVEDFF